ncbi:hypothetical protein CI610_03131 [invertebrate metagenome]|uniref:Uncharacterized protein n=1 Tax=invertebrate metagenome TaxID=1711999 RepID=A0A2H9T411_9ZZZZ
MIKGIVRTGLDGQVFTGGIMSIKLENTRKDLIEALDSCESDLRAVMEQSGSSNHETQAGRVLQLINQYSCDELLELFEISSQADYAETNRWLCLLWSRKGKDVDSETNNYCAALDTILSVTQEITDNWPRLTPRKVSRFGQLIRSAALVAKEKV